jgi:hypothetical protein
VQHGAATAFDVPVEALTALARTRPGPADAGLLHAGLHSRRLVLLRSLLARAERLAVPPPVGRQLNQHWRLLERAEVRDPHAVRHALAYPTVGNWLVGALSLPAHDTPPAPGGPPDHPGGAQGTEGSGGAYGTEGSGMAYGSAFARFLGGLGAIAATAALHAGEGFSATLPADGGRLTLPGIGVYETRAEAVRVVAGPRSLSLTPLDRRTGTLLHPPYSRATGTGWHGLRPLTGGAHAVLDDLDPHRTGPRPVDRAAPPITGGGTDDGRTRAWAKRWSAGLALLGAADAERHGEVTSLVRAVVPLAGGRGGTVSATLRCAPWGVLTELPDSAQSMASVLVHEVQHSKLAVLCDLVPLHHTATGAAQAEGADWGAYPGGYAGPASGAGPGSRLAAGAGGAAVHRVGWRSDPRPVGAVLQGTYAHLALADLWRRLADRRGATPAARLLAHARCEEYREQVGEAVAVLLGSGELTAAGERFTLGMGQQLTDLVRAGARHGHAGARRGARWRVTVR